MNVILYPTDLERREVMLARYGANVSPNTGFDFPADEFGSALGAEYEVIKELGVCVRHIGRWFNRRYATGAIVRVPWPEGPRLDSSCPYATNRLH
jgi:hypothetical protein